MTRLDEAILGVVQRLLPSIDYLALYPCKMVSQNADLTLELQPEHSKLPAYSKVPIRIGIPGAQVKVAGGARVLLGFEGGSPAAPYASLWDTASVTELVLNGTIIKLNGGSVPVAKEGSVTTGHVHVLAGSAGPFPLTGTALVTTDSIAVGAGSPTVKVP
jgi:hypothetical protein